MNGTIIDINGIDVSVLPIPLEGSTDTAYLITIRDGEQKVLISVSFGKITNITINGKNRSSISK